MQKAEQPGILTRTLGQISPGFNTNGRAARDLSKSAGTARDLNTSCRTARDLNKSARTARDLNTSCRTALDLNKISEEQPGMTKSAGQPGI